MGTTSVKRVVPIRDAVDRLKWQVAVATDFFGTQANQAFALHWDGSIVLYRQAVAANTGPGPQVGRLALVARWTNRHAAARFHVPRETTFEFETDLPYGALDRIEAFRDGGRLHARLEGRLFILYKDGGHFAESVPTPWIDDARALLGGPRVPCADILSESMELTRDTWCGEILALLRPPGRLVLEVTVPATNAGEEHGRRALSHLEMAQRAFDEGRHDEAARLVYKAGEALQQLGPLVEARYGELAQKSVAKGNAALQALCHPERHDESKVVGGHDVDRPMALHLIASMKSLAAIYLTEAPPRLEP